MKKAPTLRFKGFTNDWEQRKLGEISNIIAGGDKNINKIKKYGKYPVIANSINKNGIVGYYDNEYRVKAPAVTVTGRGEIGHAVARFQNFTPIVRLLALSSKLDSIFLANSINKIRFFNESTGVPQLTKPQLSTYSIIIPSVEEQNNIGKLILLIEKYIHLQQRKLELLKASKKAVLQNIFTDTKRVPTIRFNTFSENWNQKRLKPFLIKYNKKTTVNNQYPVLTSSRQGLFFQKDYYDGNQIASKNNIGYNIVPRNYFTYRHMSDDLIFHFNINTICDYGIVSTLYPVFTTTSEIDSQWLLYYLNHSVDIKKYALLQKQGGSRTYMYFSKLESLKAHIPALAEQKKISSLIFKIDEQIYFQQKKLKYLQKSKRFLLQNMFI